MTEQKYRIRIKLNEVEIEVEGDREFVEKHIEEFKKEMSKSIRELPPKEKMTPPETSKDKSELEGLSLAEFYKQQQPKDYNEQVVIFSYWLTKKEGKLEFEPKDIDNCFAKTAIDKPKNIPQYMKVLSGGKKAYLTKGDKRGQYKLSITGRNFVEKELPSKNG